MWWSYLSGRNLPQATTTRWVSVRPCVTRHGWDCGKERRSLDSMCKNAICLAVVLALALGCNQQHLVAKETVVPLTFGHDVSEPRDGWYGPLGPGAPVPNRLAPKVIHSDLM
jgi:hypothetical protein